MCASREDGDGALALAGPIARGVAAFVLGALASGCADGPLRATYDEQGHAVRLVVTGPIQLGDRVVALDTLRRGRVVYRHFCRSCHGEDGDGRGPNAAGLQPPPRDLRHGVFKFGSVVEGPPTDEDLARIVRDGLEGTEMKAWPLSDQDLDGVVQYVKTFSSRFTPPRFRRGQVVVAPPDPWEGKNEAEAIERGKLLYHERAQCSACHPSYATHAELAAYHLREAGEPLEGLRDDAYRAVTKPSDYRLHADIDGKGGYPIEFTPPDFLHDTLRSVRVRAGRKVALGDLYRVIAVGIAGTAMPTWQGAFPEADLWAMTHYVHALSTMKGTPSGRDLTARLAGQGSYVPVAASH